MVIPQLHVLLFVTIPQECSVNQTIIIVKEHFFFKLQKLAENYNNHIIAHNWSIKYLIQLLFSICIYLIRYYNNTLSERLLTTLEGGAFRICCNTYTDGGFSKTIKYACKQGFLKFTHQTLLYRMIVFILANRE